MHASVSVGCDKAEWLNMDGVPSSVATNNQLAIGANRFNYVFNLKGGSYVCDTACSSSLIATHLGKVNMLNHRWDPLEFHLACVTKNTSAPTIHLKTLNPHLDHAAFDAIFTSEATKYMYPMGHCQVSSFGVGGTNGHAIMWGKITEA